MNGGDRTVVLTGATGVVGRKLLARLTADDRYDVRVLSRDPEQTKSSMPAAVKVGGYEDMDQILSGAHSVIHLAARNNDQGGTAADFDRDNCELPVEIATAARRLGVSRFVFATTTKALVVEDGDHYGASKAKAEKELLTLEDDTFRVHLARMAPVYGRGARGKVRFLQSIPLGPRGLVARVLRSAIPIVSVDRVADGCLALIEDEHPLEELCLADPLGTVSIYRVFTSLINAVFVISVPTILAIPTVVSAVAVATTSRGGVLFVQRRVGSGGQVFECRKFRTMRTGAPVAGTHEVGKSYVTKVGAVLRTFKLDELPQAVNVFRREMNIIGPRPCLESQTELIAERERYGVFGVRPGITGLGQVNGVDMSEPRRLAIQDHRYAAFRSILWDIMIAIRTVLGGGFGDPVGGEQASASAQLDRV